MTTRTALVALVFAALLAGCSGDEPAPRAVGPTRHTGPQGQVGQFIAHCDHTHSAPDDPIVHPGQPGRSHMHDFYGAVDVDAHSRPEDLTSRNTSCDKLADTASYWHPTVYDDGRPVAPDQLNAYYRAAPGGDPAQVVPFPFGMALITGDMTATVPQQGEATGWTCGSSSRLTDEVPDCPASAHLHLVLTFQDCWDGEHLDSEDHKSHVAYSAQGECPDTHPVHLPQLMVTVKFPIWGPDHALTLASGNAYSLHGDFLNAWDPDGLEREVKACIHRDVVCDLVSNRREEPLFSG